MNIISKKSEELENSAVKLTVTVDKNEGKKEYNDLLKKYLKEVHISGFRKGFVPLNILEKKYGESIKSEAFMKVIDNTWKALVEEIEPKPLGFSPPELVEDENFEFDLEKDFIFSIKYDTLPKFQIKNYKDMQITVPTVKIDENDIKKELERLQEQNGLVVVKKGDTVAKNDIITIDYAETDENNIIIEKSKREDFVWTVGTGYNTYKLDDDVIGMKRGETKIISKKIEDRDVKISTTIKEIKVKELPPIDDDLAMDIDEKFKSLSDLKNDIKEKFQKAAEGKTKAVIIEEILNKISDDTKIDVPVSMINSELDFNWNRFLQENKLNEEQAISILKMQGKTKDDIYKEFEISSIKNIKDRLILDKIIEIENFTITEDEKEKKFDELAKMYNQNVEDIKKSFSGEEYKDFIESDIKQKKAIDFLVDSAKVKYGEKKSFEDFIGNR